MNKMILGATLVAIAALVGSPILAEAITEIKGVRVQMDDDGNFKGILFKTLDVVPQEGLAIPGGYAIQTENGDFIAVTSHSGILDSEAQLDKFDAIWHSHLVKVSKNGSCADLTIAALSFEEPSSMVNVRGNNILVKAIANGTATYIDAISEKTLEFTVGNPVGKAFIIESISFDLYQAEDETICIDVITHEVWPLAASTGKHIIPR